MNLVLIYLRVFLVSTYEFYTGLASVVDSYTGIKGKQSVLAAIYSVAQIIFDRNGLV